MPKKNTPVQLERDPSTGLVKGIDYTYDEDGLIDWRKLVKVEHLVPNRQRTQETDVSKLEDRDLLILLAGIKRLGNLRGFNSVNYNVTSPHPDAVFATCTIEFIPNFETEGRAVTFTGIGDATIHNTKGFGKQFLGPVAENRAFVRCVRNFLRINVVGFEEINPQNPEGGNYSDAEDYVKSINSSDALLDVMQKKGVSWDVLKKRLITDNYEGAADLSSVEDLPKVKVYELIGRLNKIED